MEAKLIVVGGKASKREIPLKLPTTIGRSRDANLTVAHAMVSRRHCELYEADGLLMVRDVGSLNGTFLGDQKIGEAPLPPGAEFTVGPLTFAVQYKYEGDLSSLPPVVEPSENRTEPLEANDATEPEPADAGEESPDESAWEAMDLVGEAPDSPEPETTEPAPTPPPAATVEEKEEENSDFELVEQPADPEEARIDEVGENASEETPAVEEVSEPEEKPVVEEVAESDSDEDFKLEEVAFETLEEDAPVEETAKEKKEENDAESDAEDEALDDFLKGLQ